MIDQHSSLSEKFLKKGFWLYLFSFIIGPILYIIKIVISWELTVSEVGILYWIISLITLVWAYNDLWMSESLKHFIPEYVIKKRYDKIKSILFYAFCVQIITSFIIWSLFFFWADYIATNYFKTEEASQILKIFTFFFLWLNIIHLLNTFFLAIQETFYNKITDFIRVLFSMIFVLSIFFLDLSWLVNYSYTWIFWLYIWVILAILIFYIKYYKTYFKNEKIILDKILIKKVFKYAWIAFLWASAWTILWQIDMQMIIYLLWTESAWYYTNYLSIIWIPFILISPIFALLFPVFSELHAKKDHTKIKLIKNIFVNNFLIIAIMFNLFFFVFAEIIAFTLFWEKFITSWEILKYSILLLVFNFLLQINFNIMAWIWKVSQRVKIIFTAVVFNFIMNYIFINSIWVYWAALATWFWWILIYSLSEYFLWKKYRSNLNIFSILKNIWILWTIAIIFNIYWLNYLTDFSRFESFITLAGTFWIWSCIFILINLNQFKIFIWEIKNIKNRVNN